MRRRWPIDFQYSRIPLPEHLRPFPIRRVFFQFDDNASHAFLPNSETRPVFLPIIVRMDHLGKFCQALILYAF